MSVGDKCYIISFESSGSEAKIISKIKSFPGWARIMPGTWAIVTSKKATEVREELWALNPKRLFVVKSGIEAAWRNTECSSEWLKKNL